MFSVPETWALYVNIGIIVFYVLFFLAGWKRGVLYQIVTTIGTVASLVIAFRYCALMCSYLHLWPRSLTPFQDTLFADQIYLYMNELICFIVLFLAARLVFHLLEKLTEGLQEVPVFKQVGSLLGGLFGGQQFNQPQGGPGGMPGSMPGGRNMPDFGSGERPSFSGSGGRSGSGERPSFGGGN